MLTSYAQPFRWPANYAATVNEGGTLQGIEFFGFQSFNPYFDTSGPVWQRGPELVYRDWLGNRSYQQDDGSFNMFWAKEIIEEKPNQQYLVTVREGWLWSDGVEMTVDDIMAARTIVGDPVVEANRFDCSEVDGEPVIYEKLGRYQFRMTLPFQQVNAVARNFCGTMPAHIFMPVYEAEGAQSVKAMWGLDTDPKDIVSGGAYLISEYHPGERAVFVKNSLYGTFVQAADGSPLPGPDGWSNTIVTDFDQWLALVLTGQTNSFPPRTVDQVRAVKEALDNGTIEGELLVNIGQHTMVDFITYNFNSEDPCKKELFRNPAFRQAMSMLIDREALVEAVYGGLGFPAKDWNSEAVKPFHSPHLKPLEFKPNEAVSLLKSIGYSELGHDGVLSNPQTACRVEFDLQTAGGLRAQEALIIAQLAGPYGVKINPRLVSNELITASIVGDLNYDETGKRTVDYDAMIWGLSGGDIDNPSFTNGLQMGSNLNAWNKSKEQVEAWEILMHRLTIEMSQEMDLQKRIEIYNERASLMREYLPITPLVSPALHHYRNIGNVWPIEALDALSMQALFVWEFSMLLMQP